MAVEYYFAVQAFIFIGAASFLVVLAWVKLLEIFEGDK